MQTQNRFMKKLTGIVACIIIAIIVSLPAIAQPGKKDSLLLSLKDHKTDSARVLTLIELAKISRDYDPKEVLTFSEQALKISQHSKFKQGEGLSYKWIGFYYYDNAEFLKAQEYWNNSAQAYKEAGDLSGMANMLSNIGAIMFNFGDSKLAKTYYEKSIAISREIKDSLRLQTAISNIALLFSEDPSKFEQAKSMYRELIQIAINSSDPNTTTLWYMNLGELYLRKNLYDSSLSYLALAIKSTKQTDPYNSRPRIYTLIAENKIRQKKYNEALDNFKEAASASTRYGNNAILARISFGMGEAKLMLGNLKDATRDFHQVVALSETSTDQSYQVKALNALADTYSKLGNNEKAFLFQKQAFHIADSIATHQSESISAFRDARLDFQKKADSTIYSKEKEQLSLQMSKIEEQSRFRTLSFLGIISTILIILGFLYYNNRIKQKTNTLLSIQKTELENALSELKSAQSRLILAEKMASLGQLTSGIAHEIQNPLNFVNNFSELNTEMLDELKSEIIQNNSTNALAIVDDIRHNSEKLTYHGKRADSIVKSMLQHSRAGTSVQENTDINKLADDCLRVSYQGLRSKNNSFHADIQTEYDTQIGDLPIVPQEMSRVMLNVYNNAFYAMEQKVKLIDKGYVPTIHVKTQRANNKVLITVKDNGIGISENLTGKIFQPFFTTKPTGDGTGLGLSISYDIIKGHGGEIDLKTEEGKFTEFIITLPY
jgi:two-component system NtrC family sensor kinase